MKTKIKIKSVFGKVLFEYEKENNTLKDTLREANLREANLIGANLIGANLREADLRYVKNKEKALLPIYCKWGVSIRGNELKIGCETKTFSEWDEWFNSNEEFETNRGTEEFNQIYACYLAYKAYYEFLKQ